MEKFELCIDHPMLKEAKFGFDASLKAMVAQAIKTKSMEGTATLRIHFEIEEDVSDDGELIKRPEISFKASYTVPLKSECTGKIIERSRIERNREGAWILINGQISMDELLEETT